ncbi:MAG TPA: MATE family efflux transporter [Epulopiscium sp.]|nr:MATE family efflux transporter [Candidatus Epulonipiscium sp.]
MALDLVEQGNNDRDGHGKQDRVNKDLPPEVHSSMLYNDVVQIAWPSFIELTLTQLASMVDLMMVGTLGPWAITAVGLTMQPKFLMMTMFMSMNVGATALVARYKGQENPKKANMVLNQAMLLTFTLSILASIVGFAFAEPLIKFMGASDVLSLVGGTTYLKIQMIGFLPMALTTTITATLRGVGDSKTAMKYNLTGNLINVILNYLLIYGHFGFPKMGVAGASLATIIGQGVAFLLAANVILKKDGYLYLSLKDSFKPRVKYLKSIFNIGIPAMIEQLVMRAGLIIYSKTVASLGTIAFATHQIAMNIMAMSFMSGQAFSVSATSLVGQSLGKNRPDMAQAYSSRTRRVGMILAMMIGSVFFLFGKQIIGLYSDDIIVINEGAKILKIAALIQPFQSSQFILAGALRGAGDTKTTAVITFITILIIRPGLAIIAIKSFDLGLTGAWLALAADQAMRSLLIVLRYQSGKWKSIEI